MKEWIHDLSEKIKTPSGVREILRRVDRLVEQTATCEAHQKNEIKSLDKATKEVVSQSYTTGYRAGQKDAFVDLVKCLSEKEDEEQDAARAC